jgi:hypothetical protein
MPTFNSEWDMPWPNEYRAESPLYAAAVGMLQGWSGFSIHTYAYSAHTERMDMLGHEIFAPKIGGSPAREGVYSTWIDPAKFGLFYHAALITRRGDVARANNTLIYRHADRMELDPARIYEHIERSAVIFDASETAPTEPFTPTDTGEVRSDTGELYRSWEKNYGTIDTARTKCAYGFLEKNGRIDLSGLAIKAKTDFATIAISSLTERGITESDHMLLTAVGRARNTDFAYDGDKMTDIGRPPVLIEVIEADIEIETEVDDLAVWAVSPEGYYIAALPTTRKNGRLSFRIGESAKSMYYLIVKE